MAANREPKSFEERTESFMNTTANIACGTVLALLLGLLALVVILVIAAAIFGGE